MFTTRPNHFLDSSIWMAHLPDPTLDQFSPVICYISWSIKFTSCQTWRVYKHPADTKGHQDVRHLLSSPCSNEDVELFCNTELKETSLFPLQMGDVQENSQIQVQIQSFVAENDYLNLSECPYYYLFREKERRKSPFISSWKGRP